MAHSKSTPASKYVEGSVMRTLERHLTEVVREGIKNKKKPERFKSSIYLEKFKRIEKNERFKRIEKNEMQGQKEMKGKVSTPTE